VHDTRSFPGHATSWMQQQMPELLHAGSRLLLRHRYVAAARDALRVSCTALA
jgi:hypothetical protein